MNRNVRQNQKQVFDSWILFKCWSHGYCRCNAQSVLELKGQDLNLGRNSVISVHNATLILVLGLIHHPILWVPESFRRG
jgi:hypothetical protein